MLPGDVDLEHRLMHIEELKGEESADGFRELSCGGGSAIFCRYTDTGTNECRLSVSLPIPPKGLIRRVASEFATPASRPVLCLQNVDVCRVRE
jgi:hypothetical protein